MMLPLVPAKTIPPAATGVEKRHGSAGVASARRPRHKGSNFELSHEYAIRRREFPRSLMAATLTPNTNRATFAIGNEQTAKRVVDLLTASFFDGQAAITAFARFGVSGTESVHFGEMPDRGP